MRDHHVRFRPIRPRSPHLNGKAERSQAQPWLRTDKIGFYATVDLKAADLSEQLKRWQHFYNYERAHGGLGGHTPAERWQQLAAKTPTREEVWASYDAADEPTREREWVFDQEVLIDHALKRGL